MISLRDLFIFLAGAAFFHTLSHIMLPYFFKLPLEVGGMHVTETFNMWVIIGSGLLTLALLWGAKKASR